MKSSIGRISARLIGIAWLVMIVFGLGAAPAGEAAPDERSLAGPLRTSAGLISGAMVDGGIQVLSGTVWRDTQKNSAGGDANV